MSEEERGRKRKRNELREVRDDEGLIACEQ